ASRLRHRHRRRSRQHARRPARRPADRRVRSSGRHPAAAFPQEHVQLRPADPGAAAAPARPDGPQSLGMRIIERLTDGVPRRAIVLLCLLAVLLVAAPPLLHIMGGRQRDVLITIFALALYFAYVGQAWNVMMGFA